MKGVLRTVAPGVAEQTGGYDVGSLITTATRSCNDVLRSKLEVASELRRQFMVPSECFGVALPHGLFAVKASAILLFESQPLQWSEICHVVTTWNVDPVWHAPTAGPGEAEATARVRNGCHRFHSPRRAAAAIPVGNNLHISVGNCNSFMQEGCFFPTLTIMCGWGEVACC